MILLITLVLVQIIRLHFTKVDQYRSEASRLSSLTEQVSPSLWSHQSVVALARLVYNRNKLEGLTTKKTCKEIQGCQLPGAPTAEHQPCTIHPPGKTISEPELFEEIFWLKVQQYHFCGMCLCHWSWHILSVNLWNVIKCNATWRCKVCANDNATWIRCKEFLNMIKCNKNVEGICANDSM